jgi:predicted MFS family arabinose efflux permease
MALSSPFRPILRDRTLALAAALLVLFGAHAATLAPYVSSLAVTVFHLSDRAFAGVMVAASLVAVTSSVAFGIMADQRTNRRAVALVTVAALTLGTALMTLAPATPMFVLAHALVLPVSGAIFGQIFALARLAASTRPEAERPAVLSTLRALFAVPWVIVLPIWAVVFHAGTPLGAVYPVCLGLAVAMLGLTLAFWPRDGATAWTDSPSGLSFAAALREIGHPAVLVRVLALGTINGAVMLYLVVIGLVFAAIPFRGAADTALYAGVMAGLEVPFMLALPLVVGRIAQTRLIFIGTVLYVIHLAGIPLLAESPAVWALTLSGAVGGAIVLTQPMAYLQEMMAERPGAGASLMALQKLAGDAFSAVCFALGTAVSGYGLAAFLGAALALAGAVVLLVLDRRR